MKKILIATTNEGKFKELKELLKSTPAEYLSLRDLDQSIVEPEEIESTIEGNAILKARYYANHSGLITIADDSGLFIDVLDGWPGVKSARIAENAKDRTIQVLEKLVEVIDESKRIASFQAVVAIVDPHSNDLFVGTGKTNGIILKETKGKNGFGYDPIFYIPEVQKTYAEMTTSEKNNSSHRTKAVAGIKRYIVNAYGGKHLVVPIGIIVRDGKILINKRNDVEKPELHGLWEFPGGGIEIGERVEENVIREIKEECGYDVEIITQLKHVWTVQIKNPRSTHYGIQIYLLPFVCKIIGGDGKVNDEEVLETEWAFPQNIPNYELIGENKKMYKEIYSELIEVINTNNL